MSIFGSSGIRAQVSRDLFSLAFDISLSMGRHYSNVVIASDTRTSSNALKHIVISGLCASGAKVFDAGMLPTPSLAFITRKYKAGIEVTASHNPPEYNGLKLWNPDGSSFHEVQRTLLETELIRESVEINWQNMAGCDTVSGCLQEHLDRIKKDFPENLGVKVVVDCGGGATCFATPYLLQELGCQVIAINSIPTGFFPRGSEPVKENLQELRRAVVSLQADLGIAHDGDGDRMVAVDEKGRVIEGDRLMLILAKNIAAKTLITTLDATMLLEESNFKVIRTKIGDTFVSEKLKDGGDFGGEASGCWIFPEVSLCPDGVYAAAKLAQIASEKKLSTLVDSINLYPLKRGSIPLDKDRWHNIENRFLEMDCLSQNKEDGIKLNFSDGWLLLRPSGTEPKLRITVEARSKERVETLYNMAQKNIAESLK